MADDHQLADPEKLREMASSWRNVSDDRSDCFEEIAASLDAAASTLESQAREIAELRETKEAASLFVTEYSNQIREDADEIARLTSQLAAAEAARDKLQQSWTMASVIAIDVVKERDALAKRLEEAERAIRSVVSADHGLECTVDHDSERGARLCPKRLCQEWLEKDPPR
jgi:chromosome segregation ATPase